MDGDVCPPTLYEVSSEGEEVELDNNSDGQSGDDRPFVPSLSGSSTSLATQLNAHHGERIGNYIIGKTLGEGAFAKVKAAVHVVTGSNVAIKMINKTKIKDDYVLKHLHREGELMRRLRHAHVICLYEVIETDKYYCLVTELASGGEVGGALCGCGP